MATADLLNLAFDSPTRVTKCDSSDSSNSYESLAPADPFVSHPQQLGGDVQLEVSGNSFVLSSRDFQKLSGLPFKRVHQYSYTLDDVSPGCFRTLVDYVLYDELPKRKKMSVEEKEEIKEVGKTLKLKTLVDHVSKKSKGFGSWFGCAKVTSVESSYGKGRADPFAAK